MAFLPFIGPIAGLVGDVLKRVLPPEKMSEGERAKLESDMTLELTKMDWSGTMAQIQVNLEEAKSEKWWKAGWRPFIGWVCGVALAYRFVLQPMLIFVVAVIKWQLPPLPTLETGELMTLVLGMLGLGGLRSWDKKNGTSK